MSKKHSKQKSAPSLAKQLKAIESEMGKPAATYSADLITRIAEIAASPSTGFTSSHRQSLDSIIAHYLVILDGVDMAAITPTHVNILVDLFDRCYVSKKMGGAAESTEAQKKACWIKFTKITGYFLRNLEDHRSDEVLSKLFEIEILKPLFPKDHVLVFLLKGLEKTAIKVFSCLSPLPKEELDKLWNLMVSFAISQGDIKILEMLVDKFSLDLKSFQFFNIDGQYTSMLNHVMVRSNVGFKEKYLKLLSKQKVDINSAQYHSTLEEAQCIPVLFQACLRADEQSVNLLLEHGANINSLFSPKSYEALSPLTISFQSGDIEFVKFLVSKGANLLQINAEFVRGVSPEKPLLFKIDGVDFLTEKFSDSEFHKFRNEYLSIVINSYNAHIKRILEERAVKASVGVESQVSKPSTLKAAAAEPESEAAAEPEELNEVQLISGLIDFKKMMQTVQSDFDVLLLEYVMNPSEESLAVVHQFMDDNPELSRYPVTSLLKMDNAEELASAVLGRDPALLHKVFTVLSKQSDGAAEPQGLAIPEGVFAVNSTFKNKVYISISPELHKVLGDDLFEQFNELLTDCKFIKAGSEGQSGIKQHEGIIRLKMQGQDLSLYTKTKYVDQSGNTLIVLDKSIRHGDTMPRFKKVSTIDVPNFEALFATLSPDADAETEGAGGGAALWPVLQGAFADHGAGAGSAVAFGGVVVYEEDCGGGGGGGDGC